MIRGRRWVRPVAGLVVAAAFAAAFASHVEWPQVAAVLRRASAGPLLLGLALLGGGFATRIARWWVMLRATAPGLPLAACVRPFLSSLALNNTLPLRAGDIVRVVGFRQALGAPAVRVAGTLVLERVLDLLALLAIFFACLVGARPGAVPRSLAVAGGVAGAAALAGLIVLAVAPGLVRRLLTWTLARGPLARHGAGWADQFVAAFAAMQSPGRAARLVGLSLLAWALEGGMYAAVLASLGVAASPAAPWFGLATGTLATLIPSSPGYVGTFDWFVMLGLGAYGAARAPSAAAALLIHLVLWLPVTLVGGLLLAAPRTRAPWQAARTAGESA